MWSNHRTGFYKRWRGQIAPSVSRNPHRSSLLRRFLVWLVAFVVVGRVWNTPTWYELKRRSPVELLYGLCCFAGTWVGVYHLYVWVPNGILASAFVWPLMLGACTLAILAVQAFGYRVAVRYRRWSDQRWAA